MNKNSFNPQDYYRIQGQISDPGIFSGHLDILPESLPELITTIQGIMLHMLWAGRHGITLTRIRKEEANLRTTQGRIAKLIELSEQRETTI